MVEIELLPRARKELLALPENLQNEILGKIELIGRFPEIGYRMDKAYRNYRCLLASRHHYRIIYRIVSSHSIEIAYIRHCRRQMGLRLIVSKKS